LVIVTSYVQFEMTLPVESLKLIVSLPVAELPLKVNVAEIVEVYPPAVVVQFMLRVQVEEFAFVVHSRPPSLELKPLSEIGSLPSMVIVWSGTAGQFVPPGSAVACCV
jgi:hypothetical protein